MRLVKFLGLVLLVTLTLCSCREDHHGYFGRVSPKHPASELWFNNSTEPEYIDPGKASDAVSGEIIANIFAGLLQIHPSTLEPMPDLARSWEVSKNGLIYTFHLRKNFWSDGQPLTAHDFEWSWKRVLDPKTASKYATLFYDLKNGEAFNRKAIFVSGAARDVMKADFEALLPKPFQVEALEVSDKPAGHFLFLADQSVNAVPLLEGKSVRGGAIHAEIVREDQVGLRALDDATFEVELRAPIPYFLNLVTYHTLYAVPRHIIEKMQREGRSEEAWTDLENLVTNGPYVLKKWKFRQSMEFEKNAFYWDASNVRTPKVKVMEIEHYPTALNLYKNGDVDWTGTNTSLPSEFMDYLVKFKDFTRAPYLSVYFYWINTKQAPLNQLKLRQALSLALDRKSVVTHITRSNQIPTSDLVPDGLAGYVGLKNPIYDPDRARKLVAEAGYPGGNGLPTITLSYNTSEGHRQIAEAIQQMWKKELNWSVELYNTEWKVHLKNLASLNFQVARHGWVGDYPDPFTFLELLTEHNGNNHSGWGSADYDLKLRAANQQPDVKTRVRMLRDAESLMLSNQPLIPIYVYTRNFLKKPYLRGHWGNYMDRHPWKFMWVDSAWYDSVPKNPSADPAPDVAWFQR